MSAIGPQICTSHTWATTLQRQNPRVAGFTLPDAEDFEEWVLIQRESLQREALKKLDKSVAQDIAQTHYSKAIEIARKQLEIDPWREETHRSLMHAYTLLGQRGDALAQFEKCKQVLREALGVEPSNDLMNQIANSPQRDRHESDTSALDGATITSLDG